MIEILPRPAWQQTAACAGVDPRLFFPATPGQPVNREAKRVCSICPVRQECLDYALDNDERGIWAGTSERERRALRYRRVRAVA